MTAQINDTFEYRGEQHDLVGIKGKGLYQPEQDGITCFMMHTACWRGWIAHYAVKDGELRLASIELQLAPDSKQPVTVLGVAPTKATERGHLDFDVVDKRVAFTGSLLLAKDFIRELYVHMGFHPPWKYRVVHELTFEDGRLVREGDRSAGMADIRARLAARPLGPGGTTEQEVMQWIEQCFDRSYV